MPPDYSSDKIRRKDAKYEAFWQTVDLEREVKDLRAQNDTLRKAAERAYMALDLFVHATKRKQKKVPTHLVRAWDELGKALGRPNHTAPETAE